MKDGICSGGNFVKIYIDLYCRVFNGLCNVRCNGVLIKDVRISKKGLSVILM